MVGGRVVSFEEPGLIVRPLLRPAFTIAYGEILTAECHGRRGIRLHTRTSEGVIHLRARRRQAEEIELELRQRGVRIVDKWGALITPTLDDFEAELRRRPYAGT